MVRAFTSSTHEAGENGSLWVQGEAGPQELVPETESKEKKSAITLRYFVKSEFGGQTLFSPDV